MSVEFRPPSSDQQPISSEMLPEADLTQVNLKRSLVADKVIDGLKLAGLFAKCATLGLVSLALAPITVTGSLIAHKADSLKLRMAGTPSPFHGI